jgi:DNA-binding NarL/FixJ family response regulator
MISVGIVDDQPLIRAGLKMIVESQPDMRVAGESENGAGALTLARAEEPDVILMDIRMPGLSGVDATVAVLAESERTRIIMLTTFDVDRYVYDSLRAGASGFLFKDVTPEQLVAAIRTVANGEVMFASSVTRRLVEKFVAGPLGSRVDTDALQALTDRERDVLAEIARGLSNVEIAERLHVSQGTVKTHVSRILAKLGLRDRVQAVIVAYEWGLVGAKRQE